MTGVITWGLMAFSRLAIGLGIAVGVLLLVALVFSELCRRARRRPSVDKYRDLESVKVNPRW